MLGLFPVAVGRGYSLVVVHRLLIAVASLLAEHRLTGAQASAGSVVVVHGLTNPMAHGIFLDQGLNPCPLNWQVDS